MVICRVVVSPELGAGEGEVPKLVNQTLDSLLLCLEPQVIAIACLQGGGMVEVEHAVSRHSRHSRHWPLTTKNLGL